VVTFRFVQGFLCTVVVFVFMAFLQDPAITKEDETELYALAHRVHENINAERHTRGLNTLRWNEELAGEARRHAANMARRRFFYHVEPPRGGLAERLDWAGIEWNRCSENLYKFFGIHDPAEDVVQAWLNSSTHRKNLLDLWMVESGVGVAVQPDGALLIVQEYMYPEP